MPKSYAVAYSSWAIFGSFGAHRLYLGRRASGVSMLLAGGAGTLLCALVESVVPQALGLVLIVAGSLWSMADVRLLRGWVDACNAEIGPRPVRARLARSA